MNKIYTDKLELLRQRIPIGLQKGLALLEKVEGNLDKAAELFQEEMILLIISKTEVTKEVATRHLVKSNFDIGLTIKSIDEEQYTLTELILRKYKDKKREALNITIYAIEKTHNINRKYWLNFDELDLLSSEIYCLLTTMEWLNYESCESYSNALSFNLDIVIEQLENKLGFADLANSLRQANDIQTMTYAQNEISKDIQNYIKAREELQNNEEYRKYEKDFITQRPILIDKLYELVKNNIGKFP